MHPVQLSVMVQTRRERENFSKAEIEIILSVVESKKQMLFSSVSSGVPGTGKAKAWREVTDAVSAVSAVTRTVSEVKRLVDFKLEAKRCISVYKKKYIKWRRLTVTADTCRQVYHWYHWGDLCQGLYLTETVTFLHQTQMVR